MKNKILIVDDDPRNIFALKLSLKARGFEIESADSAMKAIDYLRLNHDIDLVLMDMMMPDIDGYEAVKIIRNDRNIHQLPIISVTAQAMPEDFQKCIDAGADDYIKKPVDMDLLMTSIQKLI
jgi:CheY-like chemotaxis protein